MRWAVVPAPIGPIAVGSDGRGISAVRFRATGVRAERPGDGGVLDLAAAQLTAYFAGERTGFELPLCVPEDGTSEFDRAVWAELAHIPYGEMRTYGEVAAAVGAVDGARAVGAACNRNPLPLVLPCHRVVGAGGKLVGFGGGLHRKRWLLEHEARVAMQRAWG